MINLNLLSYERRHQIEVKKGRRLVQFLGVISCFLFLIMILTVLSNTMIAKKIGEAGISGRGGEMLDRVEALNDKIIVIEKVQKNFTLFTDSFADFSKKVGTGIQINELSLNKETGGLRVKGVAVTREDLINFKNGLSGTTERFSQVEISTEDISSKMLVDFEITAVVNFSKL